MVPDFQIIDQVETVLGPFLQRNHYFNFESVMEIDRSMKVSHLFSKIEGIAHEQICNETISILQKGNFLRCLCRRDTASAVNLGLSFLGLFPILLFGTDYQKERCKGIIREGGRLCFAVSEKDHGADILSSDTSAVQIANGDWLISGEKWLIGNGSNADALTILAKTEEGSSTDCLSLFCVFCKDLEPGQYEPSERHVTEGVRAMNLGGFRLNNAKVHSSSLVGRRGEGLKSILLALQVHRAVLSFMPLGVLDTGVRILMKFCNSRILYGESLALMPHVKSKLVDVFLDLTACEILSFTAARACHVVPSMLYLYGNAAKYESTTRGEKSLGVIGDILGARGFLQRDFFDGLFGKLHRDIRFLKIVDGCADVLLDEISGNIRRIFENLSSTSQVENVDTLLEDLFSVERKVSHEIDSSQLSNSRLLGKDSDIVLGTLLQSGVNDNAVEGILIGVQEELKNIQQQRSCLKPKRRTFEILHIADRYCKLLACASALQFYKYNQKKSLGAFFDSNVWILGLMGKLLRDLRNDCSRDLAQDENIFAHMETIMERDVMFSLVNSCVKNW